MKKIDLDAMSVADLRARYVDLLLQQWEFRDYHGADGKPDVRPWNRLTDKIRKVHRALKSRGDEGVDAMLSLIHHPNRNVRYASIVHCLKQRTEIVLPELEKEQNTPFGTEMKLNFVLSYNMWRNGEWLLD